MLLVPSVAIGQDVSPRFKSEMADRFAVCAAYFQIVAKCLANPKDPTQDASIIDIYNKSISNFLDVGSSLVLMKTMIAKSKLYLGKMMDEADRNCTNISILLEKYMKPCAQLQKDPEPIIAELLERYPE